MPLSITDIFIIAFLLSIVALFFFCVVKPNLLLASIFYFIFAVGALASGIYLFITGGIGWLIIWPVLFSAAGVLGGIGTGKAYKEAKAKGKEVEANEVWGKIGRRRAVRKLGSVGKIFRRK